MRSLLPLVAAVALAASGPSRAQGLPVSYPFRDLDHARSLGMGGAYRALGLGLETLTGNPAAMSLYQRYALELSGAWDITQQVAWASAGVMDSAANRIALGVGYQLVSLGSFNNRSLSHLNTIAMSTALTDFIFVGLAGNYIFSSGALRANALTGDVGVIIRPMEALSIGVSGHNIIDTSHAAFATYFTAEAAYSAGVLSACVDLRMQLQPSATPLMGLNAGGEVVLVEGIPLRAGWSVNEVGAHFIHAGGGYMFPGGAIDVAYRHEVTGIGRTVAVTLKVGS